MTDYVLPDKLEAVFTNHTEPESMFVALLPAVCDVLKSDRCFLHLRDPETRLHKNICWRRSPEMPDTSTAGWEPEQEWEREDPMFAAALRTDPSIFVDDIETAGPDVLNVEFERENLGHRALIHAHICHDNKLWGILQPCIFGHPRTWSEFDRGAIAQVITRLTPIVVSYCSARQ